MSGVPARWEYLQWLIIAAILLAAFSPLGGPLARLVGRILDRWAARTVLAVMSVGILSLLVSAAITLSIGIPEPRYHDEFSYLLAGQTFAAGRLTNPPHPFWEHFETIHVLQQPTYMSKYPPGQGLALGLGIALVGEPMAGVWLSTAAACGAVCWMLLGWLPRRWALAGGLLCALHPQVLVWGQSYWGGAVALLGSALVWGVVGRLRQERRSDAATERRRDGKAQGPHGSLVLLFILIAAGMAILANSRPYEGALVSLPAVVAAAIMLARRPAGERAGLWSGLAAGAGVLVVTGACMGYYNWRITGNALQMPYMLHDATYNRTPHFVFQSLRPSPGYRHEALRQFHDGWEVKQWKDQQTLSGWLAATAMFKVLYLLMGAFQPVVLAIPFLALPILLRRDRRMRIIAAALLLFILGLLPLTWRIWPHYAAPAAPLWIALVMGCMAQLNQWRWMGREVGTRAVVAIAALFLFASARTPAALAQVAGAGWPTQRANIIALLRSQASDDLVLVQYLPGHSVHEEWVYNDADIDRSPIVWARRMGPEQDAELIRHFAGRHVWLLRVGGPGQRPLLSELASGRAPG